MDATSYVFPLKLPLHIGFCLIGTLLFALQYYRKRQYHQLLLAIAIPSTLLVYTCSTELSYFLLGVEEVVLYIIIAVSMIISNKNAKKKMQLEEDAANKASELAAAAPSKPETNGFLQAPEAKMVVERAPAPIVETKALGSGGTENSTPKAKAKHSWQTLSIQPTTEKITPPEPAVESAPAGGNAPDSSVATASLAPPAAVVPALVPVVPAKKNNPVVSEHRTEAIKWRVIDPENQTPSAAWKEIHPHRTIVLENATAGPEMSLTFNSETPEAAELFNDIISSLVELDAKAQGKTPAHKAKSNAFLGDVDILTIILGKSSGSVHTITAEEILKELSDLADLEKKKPAEKE